MLRDSRNLLQALSGVSEYFSQIKLGRMINTVSHQLDILAAKLFLLVVEGEAGLDVVIAREEYGEEED